MNNVKDVRPSIHEAALDILADLFSKDNKTLELSIVKGNVELREQYSSDSHFLCKLHGLTFGVNKKGVMRSKVKFSIVPDRYSLELMMGDESGENVVHFIGKNEEKDSMKIKVY